MSTPTSPKKKKKKASPASTAAKSHASAADSHGARHDDAPHGPPLAVYYGIFATLMILTGVTVGAAYLDLGRWGAPVAVAIAAFKATLVLLYFMHVRYSSGLIALYAFSGFFFLLILFGFTMGEYAQRPPAPTLDPLRPDAVQAKPAAKPPAHAAPH